MSIRIMNFVTYYEPEVYMNNEQIVNSIKRLCKNNNTTITKLEEAIGLSQGLISRWGKSEPSLSKIIDIADFFNITIDEVIGRQNATNDKFLNKLIENTSTRKIIWTAYGNPESDPKRYSDFELEFFSQSDADAYFSAHKDLSYYTKINNGYISIFGTYDYNDIEKPTDIKLFIQPNDDASLIEQDYTIEQLLSLWLKVIYCLDDKAPDEIKAEELKNSFVQDNVCTSKNPFFHSENFYINFKNDKSQDVEKIVSDQMFQKALKIALQNYFNYQKED